MIGAIFIFVTNKQTEKTQASVNTDMYEEIDNKALAAQSGQQVAVSDLVDTIFISYAINEFDPNLVASLKDRIVRAELNGQVIEEYRVVEAVNWLADQFSAPTYARTSPLQIRATKVNLSKYMPNLFVDKDTQGNVGIQRQENSIISNQVSPCQATSLLLLIVEQKMLNEDFQKNPEQWDADFYNSQQSAVSNSSSQNNSPSLEAGGNSQKLNEMHQLLINYNLTSYEIERLSHGVLDQVGIPR